MKNWQRVWTKYPLAPPMSCYVIIVNQHVGTLSFNVYSLKSSERSVSLNVVI